jgi:DNA-binding transcriptional LysR family regulator
MSVETMLLPLEHGAPMTPLALAGHDCISFGAFSPAERWVYAGSAKSRRVSVHSRLVVNTADAAIDAARAGLGITRVLSYQVEASVAEGALRLILEDFEPEALPVSLLHREDRQGAALHRLRRAAAPCSAKGLIGSFSLTKIDASLPKAKASC